MTKHFRIHYLLRLSFFWWVFFSVFRICFIFWHHDKFKGGTNLEVFRSLIEGYRLDFSAISYLILIPFLLWTIQQFFKHRFVHRINHVYHVLMIVIVTILSIANIRMYGEWGTLLNYRAFTYIIYPKEVVAFASSSSIVMTVSTCILFSILGVLLYRKLVSNFSYIFESIPKRLFLMFIFPFVILVGLRGGIQQIPINESTAYYSTTLLNNHVATNNLWYLGHSFLESNNNKNIYGTMEGDTAKARVKNLFSSSSGRMPSILNSTCPNVIFIVLESWTADIIKSLGGEPEVTPAFDNLSKQGLLFTQAYASGTRTDQGLVSVFSGFPAQPNNSIITIPDKAEKLSSISRSFIDKGYSTSFYYGGEIGFANMKSYLINTGFERIIDKNNFQKAQLNSKWGAHDGFVFDRQLNDLKTQKQPFFSVLLTLSTHEPFEVPEQSKFKGSNEEDKFRNAAFYTDRCLASYFERARKEEWFKNTLFVLVADHGHHLPQNNDMDQPKAKRITMMLYGEVLKDSCRGRIFNRITNQNDIPAILLNQLGMDATAFHWSKDVINPGTKEFAYYSNENVLGWISPAGKIVYIFASGKASSDLKEINNSELENAQAYLQTLYQEFLDY